mgnify:CR=1 FL=1
MKLKTLIALLPVALMAAPVAAQDAAAPAAAPSPAAEAPAAPAAPAMTADQFMSNPEWQLALDLSSGGRVIIQLRPDMAPHHVERIKLLARRGFYNGLLFHRVIDGFMAQGGDPRGNGTGGSELPDLTAEFNALPHVRGTLSMARAQSPDSANSQFFIMLLPRLTLDHNYTVLGRVVSGMEFVDRIQRGEPPARPTRIVQASVLADGAPVPPAAALNADSTVAASPALAPISVDQLNAPQAR